MPNTTAYSFGDVVLVPFPFTDQTASKKRPAVVVSADAYHQRRPDVIVMAVTSQILRPAGALGEVLISDWQGAGLPKASLIKPVLATFEQRCQQLDVFVRREFFEEDGRCVDLDPVAYRPDQ